MISRKTLIHLSLLILCLPLGELYGVFHTPELRERNWFLASAVRQDIEWYIKDSSEGLIWIIFLLVWYLREKARSVLFSRYIAAFLLFRILDLGMYWYNHRSARGGYIVVYVLLLFSLVFIYLKNEKRS